MLRNLPGEPTKQNAGESRARGFKRGRCHGQPGWRLGELRHHQAQPQTRERTATRSLSRQTGCPSRATSSDAAGW